MSGRWPFNRPSQPKRSVIPRNEESELKRSQRTAEETLEYAQKLHKDVKKCTESFVTLAKTEQKLVDDLVSSSLCSTEEELAQKYDIWAQRLHRHENTTQEMNANINKVMVEPMRKFASIGPTLAVALKEREKCVQELNRCQAKIEKYQDRDKTGPNIVKLDNSRRAMITAKEEYDAVNQPLQQDLPKLFDARLDYMEPCLQGLVWSEARYFREAHNCYDDIYATLNSDQDFLMAENNDERMQHKLDEIRALSIVDD